jgi:hypothetical protein
LASYSMCCQCLKIGVIGSAGSLFRSYWCDANVMSYSARPTIVWVVVAALQTLFGTRFSWLKLSRDDWWPGLLIQWLMDWHHIQCAVRFIYQRDWRIDSYSDFTEGLLCWYCSPLELANCFASPSMVSIWAHPRIGGSSTLCIPFNLPIWLMHGHSLYPVWLMYRRHLVAVFEGWCSLPKSSEIENRCL